MSSSSSLLCQFLLISVVAIGTLLMIVPDDVQALECYHSVTENANSARGKRAAWELNKCSALQLGMRMRIH
jgi:hypothetical protein